MQSTRFKAALAVAYVVIVGGVAPFLGLTTTAAWLAFAALTLAPLVVIAVLWKPPARTMSENIEAARR
jgi:hypothetical protein